MPKHCIDCGIVQSISLVAENCRTSGGGVIRHRIDVGKRLALVAA
jgi:hypothetical protein